MQKLPEPPLLHHHGVFRDGWISAILCGKSGCGKTSLLMWLIPQIADEIKVIIIATKVHNVNAHLSIQHWCKKGKRPCYIMEDANAITAFVTNMQAQGLLKKGVSEVLLIFDDFSIYNHSRSVDEKLVVKAFTTWRNMGVNVIVVCQDMTMVDPKCRNCSNLRVLFNTSNRDKLEAFVKDVRSSVCDEQVFDDLLRYLKVVPYSFLMVRDFPGDIAIGNGAEGANRIRTVMDMHDVDVPTYKEICAEMGARTPAELYAKAVAAQKEIGNTAHELDESQSATGIGVEGHESSESGTREET